MNGRLRAFVGDRDHHWSCNCSGCCATRNYQQAQIAAAHGNHVDAQWRQGLGDAWYLAVVAERQGSEPATYARMKPVLDELRQTRDERRAAEALRDPEAAERDTAESRDRQEAER